VVPEEANGKVGAPVASVLVNLLVGKKELLLLYISGVGGVVFTYQPHSGDTLDRPGLPPLLLEKEGMVMPAPPILGMYRLDEWAVALVTGSRSKMPFFFMADLVGFCRATSGPCGRL
jgi:hypothetical protein